MATLKCGGRVLDLDRPHVMGVLNVTPDSFSDGGKFIGREQAIEHAHAMVEAGATLLDIGGESTRPGAADVAVEEELSRVIPVVEALSGAVSAVLSVDSSKPEVMNAAVEAGAGMLNDVRALREPGALETVSGLDVPVCLMHMQGQPRTMQQDPHYEEVVTDVYDFLMQRVTACEDAGIARERLILDPGFGFGKSLQHNLRLLAHLDRFHDSGFPLLVGMSRKSMLGMILDKPVDQRLYGSLAVASIAAWQGAQIIRVHDVPETLDVLRVVEAIRQEK
ncbi:MAG: dihydropteroate synthase [Gammaproteobacteria bacterium]|nr:dihydropteroate synthase [Gammaproteobacteria bacterium]